MEELPAKGIQILGTFCGQESFVNCQVTILSLCFILMGQTHRYMWPGWGCKCFQSFEIVDLLRDEFACVFCTTFHRTRPYQPSQSHKSDSVA